MGETTTLAPQSAIRSGNGIDYYDIARILIERYHIISFNGAIYQYKDGIYKPIGSTLEKDIQRILLERGLSGKASITEPERQIQRFIIHETGVDEYPFNTATNLIPVENGVIKINFETGEIVIIDHSHEHRFSYRLPVIYDPQANDDTIKRYLVSLGCDTDILLQIPAHTLLSTLNRNYKKAYLLKGRGNSGKTTYINLLNNYFFGTENCSNIKLQELINERFKAAGLVGKIANIADELSKIKLGDVGKFKEITGGGRITIERKFEHPYSYHNKAVLLFATNEYPPIDDVDDAFWQRWEILEFKKSFTIDPTFEAKTFTSKNISAFLNLVIERLKAIIKTGGLKHSRTLDETKQMWLYDSDSVYRFKQSNLVGDIHATIVKQDLYSLYLSYCEERENPPVSQKDFSIKMQRFGAADVQIDKGEGRIRCFQGFRVRSD